jgi:hypothetical protein
VFSVHKIVEEESGVYHRAHFVPACRALSDFDRAVASNNKRDIRSAFISLFRYTDDTTEKPKSLRHRPGNQRQMQAKLNPHTATLKLKER